MGRSGEGVSEKGERVGRKRIAFPSLASLPPSAPYFSHSLPVSYPSRKFLETPASRAIYHQTQKAVYICHHISKHLEES